MAKYLVTLLILAAGGVAILLWGGETIVEPSYRVEMERIQTLTKTIHLTEEDGTSSFSEASFTFAPINPKERDRIIVERKNKDGFQVLDTLGTLTSLMDFSDPDTLVPGVTYTYRLSLLRRSRVFAPDTLALATPPGVEFYFADTLKEDEGEIVFSWGGPDWFAEYEVKLMTVEDLAPHPRGEVLFSSVIGKEKDTLRWSIEAERLKEGIGGYIFEVKAKKRMGKRISSIEASKLVVVERREEDEE